MNDLRISILFETPDLSPSDGYTRKNALDDAEKPPQLPTQLPLGVEAVTGATKSLVPIEIEIRQSCFDNAKQSWLMLEHPGADAHGLFELR
jgi:hypothetical protein